MGRKVLQIIVSYENHLAARQFVYKASVGSILVRLTFAAQTYPRTFGAVRVGSKFLKNGRKRYEREQFSGRKRRD